MVAILAQSADRGECSSKKLPTCSSHCKWPLPVPGGCVSPEAVAI